MADANTAVVRSFLAAMPEDWVVAYGDSAATERMLTSMMPLMHPSFELHAPSELIELGASEMADGPWFSLFGEWLDTFSSYRETYTDVQEVSPGVVLVLAEIGGTTATDNVPISRKAGAVYHLEDSLIRRIALYFDRDAARTAAGL